MNIHFEKTTTSHIEIIFEWLTEPHVIEFWDNSQEHKDDIMNFIHSKKQTYFAGTTQYWIGFFDSEPYAFVLSDRLQKDQADLSEVHIANISETGNTISLDFAIGNKEYLGRGLATPTLLAFMTFYKNTIDSKANTFFIDPNENNLKAMHVYSKAGFFRVGQYQPNEGSFIGQNNALLVKKI